MNERQVNETDEELEVEYDVSVWVIPGEVVPTDEEIERALMSIPGVSSAGAAKF